MKIIYPDSLENFVVEIVDAVIDMIVDDYGDLGLTDDFKEEIDKFVQTRIKAKCEVIDK